MVQEIINTSQDKAKSKSKSRRNYLRHLNLGDNSESSLSQDKAARTSWQDKSILLINIIMIIIFIITHYDLRQSAAPPQQNAHKSPQLKSGARRLRADKNAKGKK